MQVLCLYVQWYTELQKGGFNQFIMNFRLILFLLFSFNWSIGQNLEIDSALFKLKKHSLHDTIRLKIYTELAENFRFVDKVNSLQYADSAILLSRALEQPLLIGNSIVAKGNVFRFIGKDTLALTSYDEAIAIYQNINDSVAMAKAYFRKGLVYFDRSELQNSSKQHLLSYAIMEKNRDSFWMAKLKNSLGINKMYESDFPVSLKYFLDATSIYEDLNLTSTVNNANVQNNLGLLYSKFKDYKSSIEYHRNALSIYEALGEIRMTGLVLTNLGNAFDSMGEHRKAMSYYEDSYQIMNEINDERGMTNALANIAIASFDLGNFQFAIKKLNQAKNTYLKMNDLTNLAVVYSSLGDCYLNLGNNPKNEKLLNRAKNQYLSSLKYARQSGILLKQHTALEKLASVESKLGNFESAHFALREAQVLNDSIFSIQRTQETMKLREKYEFEKMEAEIRAKNRLTEVINQEELRRQKFIKNALTVGVLGIIVFSIFFGFIYKRRRDALSERDKAEFEAKVSKTELRALRAQLNPHFIFNSLNSINNYISKNDTSTSTEYLNNFAKLMRRTLENSERELISLDEDFQMLRAYLEIEMKRMPNKFSYEFILDKKVNLNNTLVPPLIMQPFIENSIWHGIKEKKGQGRILIEAKQKGDNLIYVVDDNGVGRKNESKINQNKHHSMGMRLTKNRLDILNATRNIQSNIKFIDKEKGLRVEVVLPWILEF